MNNLGFGTSTAAPWRAGANENTTITFSHDAKVEGKDIKAGTYGLHVEVKEGDQATLILSNDSNAWGSFFYDPANDALRADITTNTVPKKELLTYEFNTVEPTSTVASLIWDTREFPFRIEFDVTKIVLVEFRDKSKGQLGFARQNWEQAANFAANNGGDLNEALGWIDKAIAGEFFSQKTYNNLSIKGRILKKMGKDAEYSALMDEAASMANMNQLNQLGYQMMNDKDYERALKYFKTNVKNNPENANVYDSLGECYKTMGDKKNAVKNLKKSLSLDPPANVRANSEKLLEELEAM
jgi:tetratricopeptide (TPR) repeat protein